MQSWSPTKGDGPTRNYEEHATIDYYAHGSSPDCIHINCVSNGARLLGQHGNDMQ